MAADHPHPRGADYLEALQYPEECFADPELAGGSVELTPLGLPRPVSGNVASVFKVVGANGRSYAVRCFVRRFDDLALRYAALTGRLGKVGGTWKVGVEYQADGVSVGGRWYPIVKMEWSEATPLLPWIEAHLWDTDAMAYLASRFVGLVESLRTAGIAHGDLQHGNILVAPGGDLRLVDYDGMFVPELARLPLRSNELGHRNYAHPLRTRDDFGPYLDGFPSWVVYASLAALSIDPLLWGRLDGGDECLLFRAADFSEPSRSEAFAAFAAGGDPRLAALAEAVRCQLGRAVDQVAPLSFASAPPPALSYTRTPLRERQSLLDVLRAASAPLPAEASDSAMAVPGPRTRWWRRKDASAAAAAASGPVEELLQARRDADREEQEAAEAFTRFEADLRHREQVQLQAVEDGLRQVLSDLSAREQELYRAEHHEQADALRVLQAQVLDGELARHRLIRANLPGVTEQVVYALALDDVRTAADIAEVVVDRGVFIVRPDGVRVRAGSLGPDEARILMGWRRQVAVQYQYLLPQALPADRLRAISGAYVAKRIALEEEGRTARAAAARKAEQVRAEAEVERARRTAELQAAKQAAAARRLELDRELVRVRKAAAEAHFHATPTP